MQYKHSNVFIHTLKLPTHSRHPRQRRGHRGTGAPGWWESKREHGRWRVRRGNRVAGQAPNGGQLRRAWEGRSCPRRAHGRMTCWGRARGGLHVSALSHLMGIPYRTRSRGDRDSLLAALPVEPGHTCNRGFARRPNLTGVLILHSRVAIIFSTLHVLYENDSLVVSYNISIHTLCSSSCFHSKSHHVPRNPSIITMYSTSVYRIITFGLYEGGMVLACKPVPCE